MFIKYDEYELLELFASEPVEINEKEAGIFLYKQEDSHGFKLSMYMSIYEHVCSISLSYKDLVKPIFDIALNEVKCVKSKDDRLIIRQNDKEHDAIIYFKPNYALTFEKQEI